MYDPYRIDKWTCSIAYRSLLSRHDPLMDEVACEAEQ